MFLLPDPASLMLVALVPSPRDLEIARTLGWYRIPLRSAPKVIAVDYLAFYQTSAFGEEHRWRVETFAEVKGFELTTRKELFRQEPDHPRAQEEYFKLALGPLLYRPEPILARRWKRLTFLYTTGELFQSAQWIDDLVIRSEERDTIWRALRERAIHQGQYQAESLPDLLLEPDLFRVLSGLWKKE